MGREEPILEHLRLRCVPLLSKAPVPLQARLQIGHKEEPVIAQDRKRRAQHKHPEHPRDGAELVSKQDQCEQRSQRQCAADELDDVDDEEDLGGDESPGEQRVIPLVVGIGCEGGLDLAHHREDDRGHHPGHRNRSDPDAQRDQMEDVGDSAQQGTLEYVRLHTRW